MGSHLESAEDAGVAVAAAHHAEAADHHGGAVGDVDQGPGRGGDGLVDHGRTGVPVRGPDPVSQARDAAPSGSARMVEGTSPARRIQAELTAAVRRRPAPRCPSAPQPNSLLAVCATSRPWWRAPSSSISLGWRWPCPPVIVVAP